MNDSEQRRAASDSEPQHREQRPAVSDSNGAVSDSNAATSDSKGTVSDSTNNVSDGAAGRNNNWPMRDVTDPRMLRAMAHPLRLKMLNQLAVFGPATATELAEKLDDSAANCSWHLRQLAKFGLIEEATDLASTGRNRPWRWIPKGNRWDDSAPELAMASDELMTAMLRMELDERRAWESAQLNEKAEWRDAAFTHQSVAYLTAEELAGVNAKIRDLILQNIERLTDPKTRPEGARPIRFVAWGVPACEQS